MGPLPVICALGSATVPRLAFLGPHATFTEQALLTLPEAAGAELVPCAGNPAVLAAIRNGQADAGLCADREQRRGCRATGAGRAARRPAADDRQRGGARRPVRRHGPSGHRRSGRSGTVASHNHGIAQTRNWIAGHLPHADVLRQHLHQRGGRPGGPRGDRRRRLRARWPPSSSASRSSPTTSPTTRAPSPASCCSPRPARRPAPTGHDRTTLPPPPRTVPGRCSGCSPSWPCAGSTSRASSRGRSRTGTPSTGSTSTAPATSPTPRWGGAGRAAPALRPRALPRLLPPRRRARTARRRGSARRPFPSTAPTRRRSRPPNAGSPACAREAGVRLVLARHGRTAANAAHILDSRPPGAPLDERAGQADEWPPAGRPPGARRARLPGDPGPADGRAGGRRARARRRGGRRRARGVHRRPGRPSDEAAFETFFEVYDAWWRGELGTRGCPGGESALDLRARSCPSVERLGGGGRRRRRRAGQPRRRDPDGGRRAARRHGRDLVRAQRRPGGAAARRRRVGLEARDTGSRCADVTAGGAPA